MRMAPDPRALLRSMFDAAIAAAQPARCIPPHLPRPPRGRLIVVGAGKGAAAMAKAVEEHYPGALSGVVVTRYGYAVPCKRIEVLEAAHPVPDAASVRAAERLLQTVTGLAPDDLVLALVSGGASSLLVAPHPPLTLQDKQALNRALLACGATIGEINCVRRHLSSIKGGRLAAAAHPARVSTLLISDVPGDDPVNIGSGPTVADPTTCAEALAILRRYAIAIPGHARDLLESGRSESIKPDDPRMRAAEARMVATPWMALDAAAAVAREAGVPAHVLSDSIEGEARDVAKVLAALAINVASRGEPFRAPCVLLSGGETTVTVHGTGRGGRNVEFLLALALALEGNPRVFALAGDTDGVDGAAEIAGAIVAPDTLPRAFARNVQPRARLDDNDGHGFFEALGDGVITGPTLTNVNDFRAIYIAGAS